MEHVQRVVWTAAVLCALAGASTADAPTEGAALVVKVQSDEGLPIEGVTVTAVWRAADEEGDDARREKRRTTDASGTVHFDAVGPGDVRVRAHRVGWKSGGRDVPVADEALEIALELHARVPNLPEDSPAEPVAAEAGAATADVAAPGPDLGR